MFPRAVSTFVGRKLELERALELIERETLFLVYGVGGLGKTELVYKLVEEMARRAPWRDAERVLVEVRPGDRVPHVLARLSARLGVEPMADDLTALAGALDAAPRVVFLDDVHHLDPAAVGGALAHLSRYVRASRIIAASRVELALPADAPAPVVTRLAPLDEAAAGEMVALLARRLGVELRDPEVVVRRGRGSPFFLQRELATLHQPVAGDDALLQPLRALRPASRALLLLPALARRRLAAADLARLDGDGALPELAQQLLVDVDRELVIVHDLVRDALVELVDDGELRDARRRLAELYRARDREEDVVEVVHQLVAAGDARDAWAAARDGYRRVAAVGLDHLWLDDLAAVRDALPDEAVSCELMRARILVRGSQIDEASAVLARVAVDAGVRQSYRYLFLAGEVALRSGEPEVAEELFGQARAAAATAQERFLAGLQLAEIASLRGDGDQARRVLAAARAELGELQPRNRARWDWQWTLSFALQDRQAECAAAAAAGAAALVGEGRDDLAARLAMLEAAARVEIDDIERGQELVADVLAIAARSGALRERVARLYEGVVSFGAGDMRGACDALAGALDYLEAHGDAAFACIAGHYLAQALLARGELARAGAVAARNAERASQAGLDSLGVRIASDRAAVLLALGDAAAARELAEWALRQSVTAPRAQMLAHCAAARAAAQLGDAAACRAALQAARSFARGDDAPARERELALESAELALMIDDAGGGLAAAEWARDEYARCGRPHAEARACLAVAAARAARGGDGDRVLAGAALERARVLIESGEYRPLVARAALIEASLAPAAARPELLARVLGALAGGARDVEARALLAALQPGVDVPPGVMAWLAALGLVEAGRHRVADRAGRRTVTEAELERARAKELVVDLPRGVICAGGARAVKGRPMTCKLLAALIEAQPATVTAEHLYLVVWGAVEYHPLRHRNTVYVAINRLRRTLRDLFPDRDLLETVPDGWQLAADLDAIAIL